MRVFQCRCNLRGDLDRSQGRKTNIPFDQILQRFTCNIFHDDIMSACLTADIENTDNIRMRQTGGSPGFLTEPGYEILIACKLRAQDFDSHPAREQFILSQVNFGHATAADALEEAITAIKQPFWVHRTPPFSVFSAQLSASRIDISAHFTSHGHIDPPDLQHGFELFHPFRRRTLQPGFRHGVQGDQVYRR